MIVYQVRANNQTPYPDRWLTSESDARAFFYAWNGSTDVDGHMEIVLGKFTSYAHLDDLIMVEEALFPLYRQFTMLVVDPSTVKEVSRLTV